MKGTVLAFVSVFVVLNTTWLYSITSSFDKDVLQWIEDRNMKKIIHRRKSESQADPDKHNQTDKECDGVFMYAVCKKQGLRWSPQMLLARTGQLD